MKINIPNSENAVLSSLIMGNTGVFEDCDQPTITVTREELEAKSGSIETVVRVIIENTDGTRAICFISARVHDGRATFDMRTVKRDGGEVYRKASASWVI